MTTLLNGAKFGQTNALLALINAGANIKDKMM
jgi:hypothetical protein